MAGIVALRDYFRNALGVGINAAAYTVKRLVDDVTITSGSTASDTDPATAIAGMLAADESTLGYPGPYKYTTTDPVTSAVREHTSKSIGQVGAWRSIDVTRAWHALGKGVHPGALSELAVTTNGTNMVISVASGVFHAMMADHGLLYACPVARTLTATAAHATLARIDTVALRFYPPGVEEEGRIDLVLLAGAPNASPTAPALTQTTTIWEEALADVRVDPTVTSLATNKVTDRRTYAFGFPSGVVAGDLLYADANGKLARLPKGTSGQYLKQGAAIPSWAAAGDASGPASSSDNGLVLFAGTGGKTLKQSALTGISVVTAGVHGVLAQPQGLIVGTTATQTLTNKELAGPTISGHLTASGASPAVANTPVGTYPGSGTSPGGVTITGNDTAMVVTYNTGSGPTTGDLFKITFDQPQANSTYGVGVFPQNNGASQIDWYITAKTVNSFVVTAKTAPPASTSVSFFLFVVDLT